MENKETIITFSLESQLFGIPVSYVKEISEKKIYPSELYSNSVKNIILLRNDVIPILSLKEFIGMGKEVFTDKPNKILIIEHNDKKCGLLVDSVSHVITVDIDTKLSDTITSSLDKNMLAGMYKNTDNIVFILNVSNIVDSFSKNKP